MALIFHYSSALFTDKPHLIHKPDLNPAKFIVKSQQDSSTEETSSDPSSKSPGNPSSGRGFGSSASASASASADVPAKKKQLKGRRDRASIIRREPVEKPSFVSPQQAGKVEELRKNESAFLLAWLGLGAIILIEGIALAASGFLPQAWDDFFVKYLYPSFTPTVFLFVAGTVSYGVLKYLQNEKSSTED